jgi:hypothetical protein
MEDVKILKKPISVKKVIKLFEQNRLLFLRHKETGKIKIAKIKKNGSRTRKR